MAEFLVFRPRSGQVTVCVFPVTDSLIALQQLYSECLCWLLLTSVHKIGDVRGCPISALMDTYLRRNPSLIYPYGERVQTASCENGRTKLPVQPIYVLQTLSVDRYVHDDDLDEELFGAWLDVYIEKQCRALVKAVDYLHLRKRLGDLVVLVATDHGYTDLLRRGLSSCRLH
jgi:hypothetical protein